MRLNNKGEATNPFFLFFLFFFLYLGLLGVEDMVKKTETSIQKISDRMTSLEKSLGLTSPVDVLEKNKEE